MESFENLVAWQKAMDLVEFVYSITKKLPPNELYGLTSQIRRASVSIIGNTAEGFSRYTWADRAHRYTIARGECGEVKAYFFVLVRLGFCKRSDIEKGLQLTDEIGKLLSGLVKSAQSRS